MSLPFEVYCLPCYLDYDAEMRDQNLQSVRNCFLRIMNDENGISELMRFHLDQGI